VLGRWRCGASSYVSTPSQQKPFYNKELWQADALVHENTDCHFTALFARDGTLFEAARYGAPEIVPFWA
jgi:hypothetical protein